MTQNLAENLIDHAGIALAANRIPELCLTHRERGFDVGAPVVVVQEVVPIQHKIVVHPSPRRVLGVGNAVDLEWNERCRASGLNRCQVPVAQVCLIRRDFDHVEASGGLLQERDEVGGVMGLPTANVHAGDDMSVHTAHQMHLHPLSVVDFPPVLLVVPTDETAGSEAGAINGELSLYGLQGEAAHCDQVLQDRRHVGIGEVVCHRVEVRGAVDQAIGLSVTEVTGETPRREASVNLVGRCEDHISEGKRGTPPAFMDRLPVALAEVSEKNTKARFLFTLGGIVSCPVLRVGLANVHNLDRFGLGDSTVWSSFPLQNILDGPKMLALHLAHHMVWARAFLAGDDRVLFSVFALGRHEPNVVLVCDLALRCYRQPSFLPCVHYCLYHRIYLPLTYISIVHVRKIVNLYNLCYNRHILVQYGGMKQCLIWNRLRSWDLGVNGVTIPGFLETQIIHPVSALSARAPTGIAHERLRKARNR